MTDIDSHVTVNAVKFLNHDRSVREIRYCGSDGLGYLEIYNDKGVVRVTLGDKIYKEIYVLDKFIVDTLN